MHRTNLRYIVEKSHWIFYALNLVAIESLARRTARAVPADQPVGKLAGKLKDNHNNNRENAVVSLLLYEPEQSEE
jgi:hypothetical protein